MKKADEQERAFNTLVRLVAVRPRTEAEAARRLTAKGFSVQVVRSVVEKGREFQLLDDRLFARLYAEDRLLSRPCARRLVAEELRRKGVDVELAQSAAEGALPGESELSFARMALRERMSLWENLGEEVARRRAAAFLLRRGFSREVGRRALEGWPGGEG